MAKNVSNIVLCRLKRICIVFETFQLELIALKNFLKDFRINFDDWKLLSRGGGGEGQGAKVFLLSKVKKLRAILHTFWFENLIRGV